MIDIIIPVYNTRKELLDRCLKSILDQSFHDFLITIVDDGSGEETKELLRKYEDNTKVSVIYNKNNQGVSEARNTGILATSSEFVVFVDADDTVDSHFLQDAMKVYEETEADIVVGCLEYISGNSITKHTLKTNEEYLTYSGKEIFDLLNNLLTNEGTISHRELRGFFNGAPVAKLYKRDLINSVQFTKAISVYEDIIFNFNAFIKSNKITIVNEIWYQYYQYSNSAIHGFNSSLLDSYINTLPFINNAMKEYPMLEESLTHFFIVETKTLLRNYFYYPIKSKHEKLKVSFDNHVFRDIIKNININTLSNGDRFILILLIIRNYGLIILALWAYRICGAISKS